MSSVCAKSEKVLHCLSQLCSLWQWPLKEMVSFVRKKNTYHFSYEKNVKCTVLNPVLNFYQFLGFCQRTLTKKSTFHLLRSHLLAKNKPAATSSAFLLMTICDCNCKYTLKTNQNYHSNYVHNLRSCGNKPWKKLCIFFSVNSRLPIQNKCNNSWAVQANLI